VSGSRSIDVYTPRCAMNASNDSIALIVSLHAWGQTADEMKDLDRFAQLADRECFVVAYPQGLRRAWGFFGLAGFSWNAGGCCPDSSSTGVDDVAYIMQAVRILRRRYACLHRDMAFYVGMSNGGMMINRLACALPPDVLTAAASVSGPLVNGTEEAGEPFVCSPISPVSIIHIHGTADSVVPFGGCDANHSSYGSVCLELHQMGVQMAAFPAVPRYIDEWRERNGLLTSPAQGGFSNGSVHCKYWGGDPRQANVTLCVVDGEGHAWPGMRWRSACLAPGFHCNEQMDASGEVWAFFKAAAARRLINQPPPWPALH